MGNSTGILKSLLAVLFYFNCCYAVSDIRPSILAGSWYPAEKKELIDMINGFFKKAKLPEIKGSIKAIIVPHAGYIYSGPVAAYAFKALRGKTFKRVILIGPSHRAYFEGASVNLQKGYETPLGIVPVDRNFAKRLIKECPLIRYLPMAHAFEHCLEIEIPFLQLVLKDFRIVPIILGSQDFKTCKEISKALIRLLKNEKDTLILASSDLSHYYTYDQAVKLDSTLIKHIKALDPEGLEEDIEKGKCYACGKGAIIIALIVSKALGAKKAIILKYANSGDVTGDRSKVVGYVSAVIIGKE